MSVASHCNLLLRQCPPAKPGSARPIGIWDLAAGNWFRKPFTTNTVEAYHSLSAVRDVATATVWQLRALKPKPVRSR